MQKTRLIFVVVLVGATDIGCGSECRSDADCDDGTFCNGAEQCSGGRCQFGTPLDCSDSISCTNDWCDELTDSCRHEAYDGDDDGHFAPDCGGEDCDDREAAVFPGADEICDGHDNDCDGVVAEDLDGDGYWNPRVCGGVLSDCVRAWNPECTDVGLDCDDEDASVHPGAAEPCDGVDNNCLDGTDDEADTDGDGSLDSSCGGDDCNDENPLIAPTVEERCNGRDDDCDGLEDEDFECIEGEVAACTTVCGTLGVIECDSSCEYPDDGDACQPPAESCNGLDDDCDGVVDNDLPCSPGELGDCITICGTLGSGTCTMDCEPSPPELCFPPEEECNGEDDDCDGSIDEDLRRVCDGGGSQICCNGEWTECFTS